jgi:hypothetical protein
LQEIQRHALSRQNRAGAATNDRNDIARIGPRAFGGVGKLSVGIELAKHRGGDW